MSPLLSVPQSARLSQIQREAENDTHRYFQLGDPASLVVAQIHTEKARILATKAKAPVAQEDKARRAHEAAHMA